MIFTNLINVDVSGNLRLSLGDFRKSSVSFENLRVIFENLWKSSGDLWHSSVIFGSLLVNFNGNFQNMSDDLQRPLEFFEFLRTNFGELRCNLPWCYTFGTGVILELHCS